MPDDEKATEQTEEIKEDQIDELEEAFAEEIEEEKKADQKEKDTEDKEDKDKKSDEKDEKDEKKETDKETKDKKEKEDKELSAKEKLDKRLEAIKEEEGEEEVPPDKEEKEEKEEKDEKEEKGEAKPGKLTKELIAERLKLIASDELPGEIIIGDETINLKQYAEDYPDDYAAIRVLSSLTAEKMIEKALNNISFAKPEDVDTKMGELALKVDQLSFDNAVAQAQDEEGNLKHPDYFTITRGAGMKDFHAWVKEQSPKIQKLASSLDPEDGILILDYYKEAIAKKKTAEHDKKAKDKKKEYDDIYKSEKSVKKNKTEDFSGEKSPDEEAKEAFEEE